jgi:hypothetical protein
VATKEPPPDLQGSTINAAVEARDQQMKSVATILFSDLARDLQLLAEVQREMRCSAFEAANRGTPEPLIQGGKNSTELNTAGESPPDPLVQDLLQRPLHEVTPTRPAFNTSPANLDNRATAHRKRFTIEEKGKGKESMSDEVKHSFPTRPTGESSSAACSEQQRIDDFRARHRPREEKQIHISHPQLNFRPHALEDEQGFREVKSPYWWRTERQHSRGSYEGFSNS